MVAMLLTAPEDQAKVDEVRAMLFATVDSKAAEVRSVLAPVKHNLTIVPE